MLVHIHDIFLPEAYPDSWAWRGYNEQLMVGALLQGGAYAPLFASRYVAMRTGWSLDGVLTRLPLPPGAFETSRDAVGSFSNVFVYDLGLDYYTTYAASVNSSSAASSPTARQPADRFFPWIIMSPPRSFRPSAAAIWRSCWMSMAGPRV